MGSQRTDMSALPDTGHLPGFRRGRPRAYLEWRTLRRWGRLPAWERDQPGYLLRLARQDAGLSQSDLARRLGISQQAVSRAESWTSNPTINFARGWTEACGAVLRIDIERRPP